MFIQDIRKKLKIKSKLNSKLKTTISKGMILNIIKYTDFNYKLKSKNIDVIKENPFLHQLIIDMFHTIDHYNYNYLSAPQVGHNLNMFIIKTKDVKEVFINPEINLSGHYKQIKEICLSFPDMTFPVDRRENVEIKYFDNNWTLRLGKYDGLNAILIQHGYDHLKGKLIYE